MVIPEAETHNYAYTWVLTVPADRWRPNRRPVVALTAALGATLLAYAVAPLALWLIVRPSWDQDDDADDDMLSSLWMLMSSVLSGLLWWVWDVVPRLASAALAFHLAVCWAYVGWHYYHHYNKNYNKKKSD